MGTSEPQQSSIDVGTRVRVKPGVTDIAFDDILLEGWTGTVVELDAEMCRVEWSRDTREAIPENYIEEWRGAGLSPDSLWLSRDSLEPIHSTNRGEA